MVRDGERVYSWGEKPEEGISLDDVDVDVVVPLTDARGGEHLQAHSAHTCREFHV
jgi:hypothetical protein